MTGVTVYGYSAGIIRISLECCVVGVLCRRVLLNLGKFFVCDL